MKKLAIFMIVLALILTIIPLSIIGYNKFILYDIKNDTYDYLVEKGYKKSDIISIDTNNGKWPNLRTEVIFKDEAKVGKFPGLRTEVIFKDEPQVIYKYMNINGEIVQVGYAHDLFEEGEEEIYKYKHIE